VYRLLRRAYAVFKAYTLNDLIRSKGFIYGLMGFSLWILLFIMPIQLFLPRDVDPSMVASYGFTAIFIFMSYSIATWDWAAELRWMINNGILEYYIVSNSGFLPHYLGLMPVSFTWLAVALSVNYLLLSIVYKPPALIIHDPVLFILSIIMLLMVLMGYALLLAGTMISSGTTGFVMELLSFILPISTGGLTPLSRLPEAIRSFALSTPFSYPAELIRYSILGWEPVMNIEWMLIIGFLYATAFILVGIVYFRTQFKKILREGVRATTLW